MYYMLWYAWGVNKCLPDNPHPYNDDKKNDIFYILVARGLRFQKMCSLSCSRLQKVQFRANAGAEVHSYIIILYIIAHNIL